MGEGEGIHHAGDHAFILLAHGNGIQILRKGNDFGALLGGGHFGWFRKYMLLVLVLIRLDI